MIELMVALIIVGIFSTVLFQLIRGHTTFTETQTAQQEAQQNVRGALELLAGELRSVPGTAIERGEGSRIRYYLPRAFGIVCGSTASTIDAVFPPLPLGTVPLGTVTTPGRFGMMAFNPTVPGRWVAGASSTSRSQVSAVAPLGACPGNNTAGDQIAYTFTGSDLPVVAAGARVAFFEVVEYDVGTSSGVSSSADQFWVRRGGTGSMQPLAGPLPAANSLSFRYRDRTGVASVSPVTVDAILPVGSVVVTLTTRSRSSASRRPAEQTDSVTIFLRN